MDFRLGHQVKPLLIVLACLATWAPALSGSFHYDDLHAAVLNYHIRSLDDPWRFFADRAQFSVDFDKAMYRPLVVLSLAVDYAIGGQDPRGYLLTNVMAHTGAALAVWWLCGLLGASSMGALLAGVLFAVHPVCAEPVNYVSARSESMAVAFGLLGVCLWLKKAHIRVETGLAAHVWYLVKLSYFVSSYYVRRALGLTGGL